MCHFTLPSMIFKLFAISLLLNPFTINWSASISRAQVKQAGRGLWPSGRGKTSFTATSCDVSWRTSSGTKTRAPHA